MEELQVIKDYIKRTSGIEFDWLDSSTKDFIVATFRELGPKGLAVILDPEFLNEICEFTDRFEDEINKIKPLYPQYYLLTRYLNKSIITGIKFGINLQSKG